MSSISSTGSSTMATELLLNKIMNGQVDTGTGKTVTAGSRAAAAELSRDAMTPALESANVKKSEAYAVEYQNDVTEIVNYLNNLNQALAGADDTMGAQLSLEAKAFLGTYATKTIGGGTPFTDDTAALDIGNGQTLVIGNNTTANDALTAFDTEVTTTAALQAYVDTALSAFNSELARTGLQVETIRGRSALLDDVAATYSDAAANQYVVDTSGVNDLLNNILE